MYIPEPETQLFMIVLCSECCLSVPDRPVVPSYRVATHTSQSSKTRGYQPTGKHTHLYACQSMHNRHSCSCTLVICFGKTHQAYNSPMSEVTLISAGACKAIPFQLQVLK